MRPFSDWRFVALSLLLPTVWTATAQAHRQYDPGKRRFVQRDPLHVQELASYWAHDGLNLFSYVGASPLNALDPTGLGCCPGACTETSSQEFCSSTVTRSNIKKCVDVGTVDAGTTVCPDPGGDECLTTVGPCYKPKNKCHYENCPVKNCQVVSNCSCLGGVSRQEFCAPFQKIVGACLVRADFWYEYGARYCSCPKLA